MIATIKHSYPIAMVSIGLCGYVVASSLEISWMALTNRTNQARYRGNCECHDIYSAKIEHTSWLQGLVIMTSHWLISSAFVGPEIVL